MRETLQSPDHQPGLAEYRTGRRFIFLCLLKTIMITQIEYLIAVFLGVSLAVSALSGYVNGWLHYVKVQQHLLRSSGIVDHHVRKSSIVFGAVSAAMTFGLILLVAVLTAPAFFFVTMK